jgi:hypothetical protein
VLISVASACLYQMYATKSIKLLNLHPLGLIDIVC